MSSKFNLDKRVGENSKSAWDNLFGPVEDKRSNEILQISLSELHTFKDHPFKVRPDDQLVELVQSIKEHGVLSPGIARKRPEGGYEIISGHSRKRACELAGLKEMPMFVKNISDDEAVLIMVDSNIQREDILPSEKARAYKMKYDALSSHRTKGNTLKQIADENNEHYKAVQRYVWLGRLSDELLEMVDSKKLGMGQGVDLSWLSEESQGVVYDIVSKLSRGVSLKESGEIKRLSQNGELDENTLLKMFMTEKKVVKKLTIPTEKIKQYFPEEYTEEQKLEVIYMLLDGWKTAN